MRWLLGAVLLVIAGHAMPQGSAPARVRPYLWSADRPKSQVGEINVFRRFSNERTAAMREFYGDLMGLTPQRPVRDDGLGAVKHPFTHGKTTINLWSFGPGLPSEAQTAGMQYIVWNVSGVDGVVRERGARVDRPLSAPGQMRTLWLLDPDGVSNYFAEFAGNDNSP